MYAFTISSLRKRLQKKKLDGNYTKILCAVLNKAWKQQLTKQLLYNDLPNMSHAI